VVKATVKLINSISYINFIATICGVLFYHRSWVGLVTNWTHDGVHVPHPFILLADSLRGWAVLCCRVYNVHHLREWAGWPSLTGGGMYLDLVLGEGPGTKWALDIDNGHPRSRPHHPARWLSMLVSSRMVAGFPSHSSTDNSRISRPGRAAATTGACVWSMTCPPISFPPFSRQFDMSGLVDGRGFFGSGAWLAWSVVLLLLLCSWL